MMEGKNTAIPRDEGGDQSQYIGHYEEAPSYMKDNEDITHGYRINFNNPKKILKSLFMVHNQIVNIWTHLCPAIFILLLISYLIFFPISANDQTNLISTTFTNEQKPYLYVPNNLTIPSQIKPPANMSQQIHNQSMAHGHFEFLERLNEWKNGLKGKMNTYRGIIGQSLQKRVKEFDEMKKNFEKVFVPSLMDKINHKIDSAYVQQLKEKLQQIKTDIDSEAYNFVEVGHVQTPNPHQVSRWPIVVFLASALICLLCSTMFHLFYPMSGRAYQVFNRLDYAGINILMAGSSFAPMYYGMYCDFLVAAFYLVIICIGAFTLFVICLFEWIHRPQNAWIKAFMYGGFGLSLSIPLFHLIINQLSEDVQDPFKISTSMPIYLIAGFSYLYGLYVYTARCPERSRRGKFNVCGHSHQIWHCLVVFGIFFTYIGVLETFEVRKLSVCPA